jgi:hypothetical protein
MSGNKAYIIDTYQGKRMSISNESIQTLIRLVEGSLSSPQGVEEAKNDSLNQLRLCRHELLQEAVKVEQERFRSVRIPFSRRIRPLLLSREDKI